MPIDVGRVVQAALQAALEEISEPPPKPKKRRLSGWRAVLLGAGLVTGGRALAGSRSRQLLESVQEWVTEDADEPEAVGDEAEVEDEPVDDADEPADDEPAEDADEGDSEEERVPPRRARARAKARTRS